MSSDSQSYRRRSSWGAVRAIVRSTVLGTVAGSTITSARAAAAVAKRSSRSFPSTSTAQSASATSSRNSYRPTAPRPVSLLLRLDRDGRALGGRRLGQLDRQQPVLERGADLAAVHRHGQADAPHKAPVGALHAEVMLVLLLLLLPLLPLDRQDLILEGHLDLLRLDPGDLGLHHQGVLGLGEVQARCPLPAEGQEIVPLGLPEALEQPVDLLLKGCEACPGYQRFHDALLLRMIRQSGFRR